MEIDDDVREELVGYFEHDIGRPPAGARERVLAGLRGAPRPRQDRRLQWATGAAAVLLAVLTVAALMVARYGRPPEPAGPTEMPAPRISAAVAYDARRGVLVVFSGVTAGGAVLDDTWTWDGKRWARQRPAVSPPGLRKGAQMTFDAARGTLVLTGDPGATWTWDGRTWARHATTTLPAPTAGAATTSIAYDPASGAVVGYVWTPDGGGQTWAWEGTTWRRLQPRTTPDVAQGAMAFDGRRLLLFGTPNGPVQGQILTETWAWDGAGWTRLSPAVRLPAAAVSAAYDEARHRVVAFVDVPGGATAASASSETWEWDGTSWRRDHPLHQPPARLGPAVQYDSRARRVVLYGGQTTPVAPLSDVWAWDGSDWSLLEETRR
jgi:hypothetical protein